MKKFAADTIRANTKAILNVKNIIHHHGYFTPALSQLSEKCNIFWQYHFSAVWTGSKSGDIWQLERSQWLDCVNNRTRSELSGQGDIKFLPNWLLLHISSGPRSFSLAFQARRIMTFTLKTQCNISPRTPGRRYWITRRSRHCRITLLLSNKSVQQWALYIRRRNTHPCTCASTGKEALLGESGERESERPAFAGTNVSARNNQSGKEENSTPEQAEHKVNVEVLGEQTACLIVWLMRFKRRPSAAQHNSSGCKCHLENAPGCLFKGQAGGCTHSLRWRWRS